MSIYLGLMSGTSMDGIDAALVDVETHDLIGGLTQPYSKEVETQIQALIAADRVALSQVWQLHTRLGQEFAAAANAVLQHCNVDPKEVVAIGSHGQTIRHDALAPNPYTIQLACPHTISDLMGMTVVADFRTRDMVVGGQGAPFAPLYHHVLFAHPDCSLTVVNIGGIANISFLPQQQAVYGYDLGPGNCLLDAWIQRELGKPYDQDGAYAAEGVIIPDLLQSILSDKFFQLPYPKSVCKSYFSLDWLLQWLQPAYAPQDVQATLVALTAHTIVNAVSSCEPPIQRLAVCGGGAHNRALLTEIQHKLPGVEVVSTQDLGIHPDFLEAMMFAWLAHQALMGNRLDLSRITGAKKPAILGAIYPI